MDCAGLSSVTIQHCNSHKAMIRHITSVKKQTLKRISAQT